MKTTQNENIIRTYKGVTLRDRIKIQDIREELEIQDVVKRQVVLERPSGKDAR